MDNLSGLANKIRIYNIEMTYRAGKNGSHTGGALSSADILAALYGSVMRYDAHDMTLPSRDRFILSKGHCAAALYAALCAVGVITEDELYTYNQNGSDFPTHCVKNVKYGIEISSGSLGLGLGYAVGVGKALKMRGSNSQVFVLMGDGECAEGSVWEAAAQAAALSLDNITLIIDKNGLQLDGSTDSVMPLGSLQAKLNSFGWSVSTVDGHCIPDIVKALSSRFEGKPNAIIANTIKGKGVSFMENDYRWHHAYLDAQQYAQALEELGANA